MPDVNSCCSDYPNHLLCTLPWSLITPFMTTELRSLQLSQSFVALGADRLPDVDLERGVTEG